jgi:hypothetical protein
MRFLAIVAGIYASINRIRALAKELVGLQPDIILTAGEDLTAAVQRETRTIPTIPRDASPSSPRRVTIRESEDLPGCPQDSQG